MQRQEHDSSTSLEAQEECEATLYSPASGAPPESVAEAPGMRGRTANDSPEVMVLSVTHHDPITNLEGWKFLSCGIDSLDLGVYVKWGDEWEIQTAELEEGKAKAAGTQGVTMNDGQFLILPSGRRPSYRWHLQWADFHLFLGVSRAPQRDSPNVYASINSETLWRNGMEGAVALVRHEIENFGGTVLEIKPSRCDLAADFQIPGGIPHELLLTLRVSSESQHVHHMKGNRQETFYQGAKSSPVQMRIYDKGLEVLKGGTKLWFLEVWNVLSCESVWRVEFQLRREYLKQFGIHTIAALRQSLPGLWKHLTEKWFSLRLLDDSNISRRTIHPWWLDVQCCDARFGEPQRLVRSDEQSPADAEWFVSHGAGCLLSFAARRQLDSFDVALKKYGRAMQAYWERKGFAEAYIVKSIQLGFVKDPTSQSGASDGLEEVA